MRYLVKWIIEVVLIALLMLASLMWGIQHGKKEGWNAALTTNPPSDELEYVCAGLWVGEQNKEFVKRNAKK